MNIEMTVENGIGCIQISNPPFNSFISPQFLDPLSLDKFLENPELKALVIKGEGRHFSSGADIPELMNAAGDKDHLNDMLTEGKKVLSLINEATVPVFALIRGSCFGAGFELALACHFRFASRNAMFGFPESTLGILPGMGGTVRLGDIIAKKDAIELLISGKMIGAEEAHKIGLIDKVENTTDVEKKLYSFIENLTKDREPKLLRVIMTAIQNARRLPRSEAFEKETALFCSLAKELRYNV